MAVIGVSDKTVLRWTFLLAALLLAVTIGLVPALSEFCKLLILYSEFFVVVLIPGVDSVFCNKNLDSCPYLYQR